ncbi:MAG: AbrB/MazE/SpoVT family DNA-binding domain-containing protein [Blastocatellia bacterium]
MRKNLTVIGNSLGLIIEKPILDILGITRETELEMKTDGHRLVIEPVDITERKERVRSITRKIIKSHEKTFRKLAE